jgi:thiamine biosynthesis lipoprotein
LRTGSNRIRRARPLLGTFVEVQVGGAPQAEMNAAIEAAFEAVANVHNLMSFHESGSDVSRVNAEASARPVRVHPWTFRVLQAALDLHRLSAGAFDIAVAPRLQQLGLLPRHRDHRTWLAPSQATTEAIELLPGERVRFKSSGTRIDLGGIAKGFAVDRAIDVLRSAAIPTALVNAGGDLAAFGPSPHTVAVRDPRDPRRLMCRIVLGNEALASSGRYFDPFGSSEPVSSAVIDPSSQKPSHAALGATVRAPSCMLADALTKVVMLAGPSATALLDHYRAGALVVSAGGIVRMTRDLQSTVCLAT